MVVWILTAIYEVPNPLIDENYKIIQVRDCSRPCIFTFFFSISIKFWSPQRDYVGPL